MSRLKKKNHFLFLLLTLFGCANVPREPCPTVEAEPVSTCRAIEKCRDQRTTYGMGVGAGVSPNVGIGISQSQNSESYTNCIDQELKDQENQAKIKRAISNETTPATKAKPGLKPGPDAN